MCTSENKGPAFGIRMKPSLRRYVEQWPGKNFSDKLEAMISFYQEHEKEQRQKLAALDRSIRQRQAELEAVSSRALEMRTLETQLKHISSAVEAYRKNLTTMIQESGKYETRCIDIQ